MKYLTDILYSMFDSCVPKSIIHKRNNHIWFNVDIIKKCKRKHSLFPEIKHINSLRVEKTIFSKVENSLAPVFLDIMNTGEAQFIHPEEIVNFFANHFGTIYSIHLN